MGKKKAKEDHRIPSTLKIGAIALAFLIIGYQAALFIRSAAEMEIVSHRDNPDTVFVIDRKLAADLLGEGKFSVQQEEKGMEPKGKGQDLVVRKNALHSPKAEAVHEALAPKKVESFDFDPNTVSLEDLVSLGFSEKQAQAIINYREKGGRFKRAEDFAKSYVVQDSVFNRLKDHIKIPKVDINSADSAAFDALPGIGPYFAAKMLEYREKLGSYSYPEQLMDIYNFDEERYRALEDLIYVGDSEPYGLWSLPEEELAKHPYIGKYAAHGIVLFRENSDRSQWTVEALINSNVLDKDKGAKLAKCRIGTVR